jgi:hypothetical protein
MRKHSHVLVLITMLLFTFGLFAQESAVKGGLAGTVFDSSGAVVSGAKITLVGPIGTATATTDSEGRFAFDRLTPGFYGVKAEMTGFKITEVRSVEVFTNRSSGVRLTLEPGGVTETVEVSAAAVGVDLASTGVAANLNDTFYQNLPVARNVTGLFYASAGVAGGGGTGAANPSIAGGSGLENQYVADGVNITDGAFGGIGVYSRVYGPLATGINLSFVKEVQVKTAGYEPQYGKSTGGIVQIVTKSGTNDFHGQISGFLSPKGFEARRVNPDSFDRFNQGGLTTHQGAWDVNAELGGPVPGLKNKLFFFAAFNPSYNAYYDRFADMHGVVGLPVLPDSTLGQYSYDYSGKLTWKLGDKHSIESSVFGDPTRETGFRPNFTLATFSPTTFDKLSNGTRNWVARYNGTLSPTWLFNASFSWGHNYLTDTPGSPDVYAVADLTGRSSSTGSIVGPLGPLSGQYQRQGLGFFENTEGDNYALNFDTQKIAHLLGEHTLSVGYRYERNTYAGSSERTGPKFPITQAMADAACAVPGCNDAFVGLMDNASFQLRVVGGTGVFADIAGRGPTEVALLQTRGTFSNPNFTTHGRYHAAYANDSWALGRRLTVNVGWRWEQQWMQGSPYTLAGVLNHVHYTYTDNWSPRIGLSIDPLGDRKTKLSANWARYNYAIPLDMAIRSLSNEQDAFNNFWLPPHDAAGNMLVNPDGSIPLTAADFNDSTQLSPFFVSGQSGEAIAPGTKMQYLDEFAAGVEHEWRHGIVTSIRFQQRRLRRIVEDMAGPSPEAANAGVPQLFVIGNPLASTDLFVNGNEIKYPSGAPPAACAGAPYSLDPVQDTFGNDLGGVCITNLDAGAVASDGKPDGFVNPVRNYKAVEVEISKSFSAGWQMRTNYRWSTLAGNYEGAFRNDNGQSDPSISSLFDFTPGVFNLLGDQFAVGFLNTDRRHVFNNFISYTFSNSFLKNLTLGTGVRVESGVPANDLKAHPVYLNAGEIPVGGRGSLGRIGSSGQADIHADYFIKTGEQSRLHFGADLFNITNQRTQLRLDQNEDRSFGVPNVDFKRPVGNGNIGVQPGFQRPFYGRLFVRWEF